MQRMNCSAFLQRVADRSGYSLDIVSDIYAAGLSELESSVMAGYQVYFRNLGSFYKTTYQGHKVPYGDSGWVDPYPVLKFQTSNALKRRMRQR